MALSTTDQSRRLGDSNMIYGYARVSTRGQERDGNGLDAQISALVDAGCAEIVSEAFTGTKTDRPEFRKLLERLTSGDTLVVAKLDRIARTSIGGCEVVRDLLDRGVSVRVLNMGTLDNTPVGKMMVAVMFAMAEFERDMIVQRTSEGKAIARQREGWHEGRPRIEVDMDAYQHHLSLVRSKQEALPDALKALGIGRTKWYELAKEVA